MNKINTNLTVNMQQHVWPRIGWTERLQSTVIYIEWKSQYGLCDFLNVQIAGRQQGEMFASRKTDKILFHSHLCLVQKMSMFQVTVTVFAGFEYTSAIAKAAFNIQPDSDDK